MATPLIPSESAASHGTGVVLIILWFVLLCAWLLEGVWRGRLELRLGATGAVLLILLLLHSTSAMVMGPQGNFRSAINIAWQWLGYGMGFFLVRQLVREPAECRALYVVMIALAICLSVDGVYQCAYSVPRAQAQYQRGPEEVLRRYGIDTRQDSPQRKWFDDRLRSKELIATFALANSLAGYLAPWLTAAAAIALVSWRDKTIRPQTAYWAGACAACAGVCLLLTKSRTGCLAAALGALLLAAYAARSRASGRRAARLLTWLIAAAALAVLLLLILAFAAAGWLDMLVLTEAPKAMLYRWQYWRAAAAMMLEHPWFGCGPGNFQQYYTAYKLPEASETVADPHNFLLEMGATAGAPALLALLAVLLAFFWQALRAVRRGADPDRLESAPRAETGLIYAGGVAGVAAAYPCGWAVGFPQELAGILLGSAAAAAFAAPLHRWVALGRLPVLLPVISLAVLLANLLAAGALGFPGVSQTCWLLMAITLNLAEADRQPRGAPRSVSIPLLLLAAALAALFYRSAFQPVLRVPVLLGEGERCEQLGRYDRAEEAYREAADADPLSPEPWWMLAKVAYLRWLDHRTDADFQWVEACGLKALSLDRRSSHSHTRWGNWRLTAFRVSHETLHIRAAVAAYRRAVELYPNSNIGRAQLAWALHLAGEKEAAERQAAAALRLDALNPHNEQKLASQQVYDGQPPDAKSAPLGAATARELMAALLEADGGK